MQTIKNVMQLFVAKDQSPTAALEGDTISDVTDLKDGEVCITDYKNVVLDGSGAMSVDKFKFIQRSGDKLIQSDIIEQGTVDSCTLTTQSAGTRQVDYVGYNGSSGALDTTVSNLFTIRLYINDVTIAGFMQQKVKEGFYKSAASTSQEAIAQGLVKSLIKNYSREPEQDLHFARVNSGSQVALGTSVNTVTLTKGSKYFSASDIDDATGTGTALAAGDYLVVPRGNQRKVTILGSSGTATVSVRGLSLTASFDADASTTAANFVTTNADSLAAVGITVTNPSAAILLFTTVDGSTIKSFSIANATGDLTGTLGEVCDGSTPVYLIEALDTTNNIGTLDVEYQGESIVYDDLELMQLEDAGLGNFGIKIEALDRDYVVGKFASQPVTFDTTIDFGSGASASVTNDTASSPGQGTWQQLGPIEKELQADEYIYRSFVEGAPEDRADVEKYGLYDVISLNYNGEIQSGLGITVKSPKTILIALKGNTAIGDDANTGIVTTLNQIFGTDWSTSGFSSMTPTA